MRKIAFVACVATVAASAVAADATWYDAGTGIWDLTALNWNGGASAWTAGDTAVFAGTGGVVTVEGAVDVAALTFNASNYVVNAATGASITNSSSGTLNVTVAAGQTATLNASLRTDGAQFYKYGDGTLVLGGTNQFSRTKDSRLKKGMIRLTPDNARSLGTKDFIIESGATLDLNGCCAGASTALPWLHPNGTGVDGMGALVNTGKDHTNKNFGGMSTDSDVLLCGPRRIDVGTLYMLGHTVTVSNIPNQLCVSTLTFKGNESLVIASNAVYTVLGGNGLGAAGNNGRVVLKRSGRLNVWDAKTMTTSVFVEEPSTISQGHNVESALAKFTGTIAVNTNLTVWANPKDGRASWVEFAGPLTGNGRIRLTEGHLRFSTQNNTWSGQLAQYGSAAYRYVAIGVRKGATGTLGNVSSIYGESGDSYFIYERTNSYTLANCAVTNGIFGSFDGGTLVFDNVHMTNTAFIGAVGNYTFRNTKVDSSARYVYLGSRYTSLDRQTVTNVNSTLTIEDGSDLTFSYLEAGNGSDLKWPNGTACLMTGIVNQTGGRLRTVGAVDASGGNCGIHFGHWPQARTFYNLSGGVLTVDRGYKLAVAVDGQGTLHQTGNGTYVMEGGELNVGAGGIITGNGVNPNAPYTCTLRGGTIRATADTAFRINATLNSTNAANNVAFDTAGHSLSVSNTLSGAGGLTKTGAGTMTVVPAATYTGTTRLAGGTLAFKQAYPGGALEVAAAAVQGTGTDGALLTAPALAFTGANTVRVTEAETLDMQTFGQIKTVARLNTALSAVPELELVKSDGTPFENDGKWRLILAEGGKALRFGPLVGTRILVK